MGSIACLAMSFAARGRIKGHPPGELDGVRFEEMFTCGDDV